MKKNFRNGRRMTEILKQPQYSPLSLEKQVTIMYAVNNGYFNVIPVEKIAESEAKFHKFMEVQGKDVLDEIRNTKEISESSEAKLKKAIENFIQQIN
jgi:F-type H+-transporting ATPase subunit alpha